MIIRGVDTLKPMRFKSTHAGIRIVDIVPGKRAPYIMALVRNDEEHTSFVCNEEYFVNLENIPERRTEAWCRVYKLDSIGELTPNRYETGNKSGGFKSTPYIADLRLVFEGNKLISTTIVLPEGGECYENFAKESIGRRN